jgi:two-component system response regulator QseB
MRVLLVEDDALLGDGIKSGLSQAGFGVDWAKTCEQGRLAVTTGNYEVLVLDLGLPDESGFNLLRELRSAHHPLPVLILTARDTLQDKLAGFSWGADDYLVKPFELDELIARLHALIRRFHGRTTSMIRYGNIEIDPEGRTASQNGTLVDLPHREFTLLEHLIENQGRVLTRTQLEQSLYGWNAEVESNAIEVHVHHLRKKLGAALIKTVRGVGYMIEKKV